MRQVGFLAAAGLYALDTIVPQLVFDHKHTHQFAQAIQSLNSSIFQVDVENVQTNILMIKVKENDKNITALNLSDRLAEVTNEEIADEIYDDEKRPIVIKSSCKNLSTLRVVFYHQINDELTILAMKKISYVMRELENLH